jgi:hypothetical protein
MFLTMLGLEGIAKRSHHIGGRRKSKAEVANLNVTRFVVSAGSADEIPFAPSERFVHGNEMGVGNFLDERGLGEPLLVGAALEMNHGGECVHPVGKAAGERIFRDGVHESQEGSQPRFDEKDAAVISQDALHFCESLIEIIWKSGQMVQAALDDEDVLGASGERKFAAIGDNAFRWPAILSNQPGR